jgi:threonine dehydrogenase-like Zn-dependent dehydrogenase
VTIVESVNKNTTSIDHRVNTRVEIANIDTIINEKRKYDTIICDDITSLEKTILTAMRISNPGSTIIMNGIEKPEVAAIWNKYVDMLELQLCSSVQYTDTETQSVRVIL